MSIEQTRERPNIAHLLRLGREVPNGVLATLYVSPEFRAYADRNWQMVKPMMVPIPSGCLLDQLDYSVSVDEALEAGIVCFVWEGSDGVMQRKGIQYLSLPAQGLQDAQKA